MLNVKLAAAALAAVGMAAWTLPVGAQTSDPREVGCSEYGMTAPPLAERKKGAVTKDAYVMQGEECGVQLAPRGTREGVAMAGNGAPRTEDGVRLSTYEFVAEESGWQLAPREIHRRPLS